MLNLLIPSTLFNWTPCRTSLSATRFPESHRPLLSQSLVFQQTTQIPGSEKEPSGPATEPFGQPSGPIIPSDVLVTIDKVDPFGLDHEFKKKDPLDEKARDRNDDIGWKESDLPWDINPTLNRSQRRAIVKMLRKHIKVFVGPEGRLGRVDPKFDMDIHGDLKDIKSQQTYRTSPEKQKHIKDAIDTLSRLDVIEPSNSSVASPVIVVIQHDKPRFCVDLREANSKIAADRYAETGYDFGSTHRSYLFHDLGR